MRVVVDKPYDPSNPSLGYCYKYQDVIKNTNGQSDSINVYNIVCSTIGIPRTDFRVLLHEYGHVYLSHLDGIHEELDQQICTVFRDYREELVRDLNKSLNIDYAEKLIERVIDDKSLNHSLHNIAMDMEVNTKILSPEDIEEMEKDISTIMPQNKVQDLLVEAADQVANDTTKSDEERNKAKEFSDKMRNQAKIKLILPERYHFPDGSPFPDDATYPEYLIMIIKNLDQFVKMMVSIQNGGNGDTSQVSDQDVQDALNGQNQEGSDGDNSDSSQGMQSLSDLMESMGMSDGNGEGEGREDKTRQKSNQSGGDQSGSTGGKGNSSSNAKSQNSKNDEGSESGGQDSAGEDTSNVGGKTGNGIERHNNPYQSSYDESRDGGKGDHATPSREEADAKRDLGQIKAGGGVGCGTGNSNCVRQVDKDVDAVDMAIEEVIKNFSSKVIKRELRKDSVWYWNRGINRTVLAPAYRNQVTVSTDPKVVYLIDVSGSMATSLVDRILKTIGNKMKKLGTGRGLKYDIITWSTRLGEHMKDIDPRKPVPRISCGGGTEMALGIKYFRDNYDNDAILVLISDFEDDLNAWNDQERSMNGYTMYGFNYGRYDYRHAVKFKNMKVKNFNDNDSYSY